jgi:hypothetical protein
MMVTLAKIVPSTWVLAVMNRLQPVAPYAWIQTYSETADAIAEASNNDPLFAGEDGPMRTAALLLAIAYKESRFKPTAVGDHGHSYGLFQIQPQTANLTANVLLVPREAAPVAINLIRTSFRVCGHAGWHDRLSWYCHGGNGCHKGGNQASQNRIMLAEKIIRENPEDVVEQVSEVAVSVKDRETVEVIEHIAEIVSDNQAH